MHVYKLSPLCHDPSQIWRVFVSHYLLNREQRKDNKAKEATHTPPLLLWLLLPVTREPFQPIASRFASQGGVWFLLHRGRKCVCDVTSSWYVEWTHLCHQHHTETHTHSSPETEIAASRSSLHIHQKVSHWDVFMVLCNDTDIISWVLCGKVLLCFAA